MRSRGVERMARMELVLWCGRRSQRGCAGALWEDSGVRSRSGTRRMRSMSSSVSIQQQHAQHDGGREHAAGRTNATAQHRMMLCALSEKTSSMHVCVESERAL
mmetsp:Transcript_95213/g.142668  ORF Transcript_95213/g.142668 Transcript_95213/m.142668 type:complete len:103 (+) Transcript_95213:178-486(+)